MSTQKGNKISAEEVAGKGGIDIGERDPDGAQQAAEKALVLEQNPLSNSGRG
jgi:hypothetical protein